MDVLVSIAVIAVLIGLLIPSLAGVRSLTDRVVCASNQRQIGVSIAMHADDHKGALPESIAVGDAVRSQYAPEKLMAARRVESPYSWDGLGWLYQREYLAVPDVYYCPAHTGDNSVDRYRDAWAARHIQESVLINYQFRGVGPMRIGFTARTTNLWQIAPGAAIVADGLQTRADFNHANGTNVLRTDMSVGWFEDESGSLQALLPATPQDVQSSSKVQHAWQELDAASTSAAVGR